MDADPATANIILRFGAWGFDSRTWAQSTRRQYQAVTYRAARQIGGIEVDNSGQERVRIERLLEADQTAIREWLSRQPRTAETRNHALAILDAFFQWLIEQGVREDNPTRGIRRLPPKRHQPRALGQREANKLLHTLRAERDMRVQAMVGLMIWAGLRVNEALHTRWTDISPEGWLHVTRDTAKGGHERQVPLHVDLQHILSAWEPQCPSHEWVVPSAVHTDRPVSYSWAYQRVRELGERAGLQIHPHKLRGTFATGLLDTGTDVRVIAEALGHRNVQTTMKYTKVRPVLVADAVQRLTFNEDTDAA